MLTFVVDTRPFVFKWEYFQSFYKVATVLRHIIHRSTGESILSDLELLDKFAGIKSPSSVPRVERNLGNSNSNGKGSMRVMIAKLCNAQNADPVEVSNVMPQQNTNFDDENSHQRPDLPRNNSSFSQGRFTSKKSIGNRSISILMRREIEGVEKHVNENNPVIGKCTPPELPTPMMTPQSRPAVKRNSLIRAINPPQPKSSLTTPYLSSTTGGLYMPPPLQKNPEPPAQLSFKLQPRRPSLSISSRTDTRLLVDKSTVNDATKKAPLRALSISIAKHNIGVPCTPSMQGLTNGPKITLGLRGDSKPKNKKAIDSDSEDSNC